MRSTHITGAPPVGLILAGGPGTRIGGNKAMVALHGQPLLHHALAAMREVVGDVAIIAKSRTELPRLDGAMVWIEPERPSHPLLGVSEALALAGGRPVLVCPVDMPLITPGLLSALARASSEARPAVLACSNGAPRPLVGRYTAAAAPMLAQAAQGRLAAEEILPALEPKLYEVEDEAELFDVNTPDDLLQAAGMLDRLRRAVRA